MMTINETGVIYVQVFLLGLVTFYVTVISFFNFLCKRLTLSLSHCKKNKSSVWATETYLQGKESICEL